MKACPCHSTRPYQACCQPYHQGQPAPTPLALMRSRFAAYALGKVGYIIKTERPDNPPHKQNTITRRKEIKQFCQNTQFVGLQIIDTVALSENSANVTFHAILKQDETDVSFIERSFFEKRQGHWHYVKALSKRNV